MVQECLREAKTEVASSVQYTSANKDTHLLEVPEHLVKKARPAALVHTHITDAFQYLYVCMYVLGVYLHYLYTYIHRYICIETDRYICIKTNTDINL